MIIQSFIAIYSEKIYRNINEKSFIGIYRKGVLSEYIWGGVVQKYIG